MKKLINIIILLEVCIFPSVFVYSQNVYESKYADTLMISLCYIMSALLICGLLRCFLKNWSIIICIANIFMLVITNFELPITRINSNNKYIVMTLICFTFISIIIALILKGKIVAKDVNSIFLLYFLLLFFLT